MADTQLYLMESDVPPGAVVLLCPPGSDEPAKDDGGWTLSPLQCLIGGISNMGPRFYPVASLQPISVKDPTDGRRITAINTNSYSDFHAGVRFVPTQVYGVADAPADTRFAVFQNGRRLKCSDLGCTAKSSYLLSADKAADGSFTADVYYECDLRGQDVTLPSDVVLLPTTEAGGLRKKPRR